MAESSSLAATLPPGYSFHDAAPPLETYLSLRRLSGLSPKSPAQGAGALAGSWAWCTILYTDPSSSESASPEVAGMIRAFGDGGWYFTISDMAVFPAHQRRGLGKALLQRLIAIIHERAPPEPLITLFADPPGRALYKKCGFVESAPRSLGMWMGAGDVPSKDTA